jgi:lipopolysaccharide export LptBFGC system permease protein LptF
MGFTLTLTLGAGLLAIWFDARFTGLRPKTPGQGLAHAAVSVLAMFGAVGLLSLVYGIPQQAFLAVVLGAFLPTLVYALVAGIWMLRTLADLTLAGR